MNQVQDLVGKISQSNQYLVSFSALKPEILQYLGGYLGINNPGDFLSRKSGLLCSEAVLPTTSYATGEVKDNFMGIPQEFAHTRLYTDIDFTFYIDTDYTNLRIFEGWMDFISSGSHSQVNELRENYYKRYRYPDDYKVQTMFISKFEKDITSQIDYQFINAFPKTMTTIPVAYGDAELLKVSVTFNYDRYIVNPRGSYITSPNLSEFDDIPRTFLDTRYSRYAQSLFNRGTDPSQTAQTDSWSPSASEVAEMQNLPPDSDQFYQFDPGNYEELNQQYGNGSATGGGQQASDSNQTPSEEKQNDDNWIIYDGSPIKFDF